jgi:uncharacterized protein YigA (DUF484 family)
MSKFSENDVSFLSSYAVPNSREGNDKEDNVDAYTPLQQTAANVLLTDELVMSYIDSHPEFLQKHESIIAEIAINHEAGGAISLLERQVLTLRARNRELSAQMHNNEQAADERLSQLVTIARDNEKQSKQFYKLAQFIISALVNRKPLIKVQEVVIDYLEEEFSLDCVKLLKITDADAEELSTNIVDLIRYGVPVCGPLSQEWEEVILQEDEAELVNSAALLPIRGAKKNAVLLLGSADEQRFHLRLGTHMLRDLSRLIAEII